MALSELYIVASDLEQLFRNKDTGLPLANGKIYFYRDADRQMPKEVFQLSGDPPDYTYTSMGAEITLSAIGTVQNAGGDNQVIYYYPWRTNDDGDFLLDLYYVVVEDENGIEQFVRPAWPNLTAGNTPIDKDASRNNNQISNGQFTNMFINEGFTTTLAVSGLNNVFKIAPDWDLVASGSGTVEISRLPITGNNNIVTSPPYVLDINVSSGVSTCYLRQRMNTNSGLWASTTNYSIYLSACIVGRNQNSGTAGIQILYRESSGNPDVVILDKTFENSAYSLQVGASGQIPFSTNVQSGTDGYIDILVSILESSHVRISSIQVAVSLQEAGEDLITYEPNSSNRNEAYQGDYFLPNLARRPAKSMLTGWDFPINPFQFQLPASGTVAITGYLCDQTIAGTSGANVDWSINNVTGGLVFASLTTNNAFFIMQYLSGDEARKIIGTPLSVNACAWVSGASDDVTMRVYLIRGSSLASIPTLPTIPGTVAADGTFTLTPANNWSIIPRSNLDTAKGILPAIPTNIDLNDLSRDTRFSGWQLTDDAEIANTDKFAIIVTFGYIDTATSVYIDSISLVPSEIPARPAPQTEEEVLCECQKYYEKSYDAGNFAGDATTNGCIESPMHLVLTGVGPTFSGNVYPYMFGTRYNTKKRVSVTPAIYSTVATTASNVQVIAYEANAVVKNENAALSNWSLATNGEKGFTFHPQDRTTAIMTTAGNPFSARGFEGIIQWHYVSDARLGIV